MNILIDADGCPVVNLTLQIAKRFGVPVIILCDTAHQIEREGAQTLVFDKGADSVDFALVNRVKPGDAVGELPAVHIAIVCGFWQGASYSGAHPVFCFALNLLAHGFQPHSSNISPGHRSESDRHSPAGHYR